MIAAFARVSHRHRFWTILQYLRAREAEAMCDHVWIGPPGPGPETEPEPVNHEPVEAEVGQPQPELSVAAQSIGPD